MASTAVPGGLAAQLPVQDGGRQVGGVGSSLSLSFGRGLCSKWADFILWPHTQAST